jgi:hypothetical protein
MQFKEFITQNTDSGISPELQKLIDIAVQNGNKMAASKQFKYQLYMPRDAKMPFTEDMKPNAQLWTSTAIRRDKNVYTSEWVEWCDNNAPGWMSPKGSLYEIQSGAKILNIGSDDAARKIAKVFGQDFKGMGQYAILGKYPWEELGKYFDAVRYPAKLSGKYSSRLNNILMSLWDVESTAWYNTSKLRLVSEVNIKARGW